MLTVIAILFRRNLGIIKNLLLARFLGRLRNSRRGQYQECFLMRQL